MKFLRPFLFIFIIIFTIIYLCFLFVVPNSLDISKYSPQISDFVKENTGLILQFKEIKVKTSWNLSAGANIEKIDLLYPTGKKFAQINNLEIKLSLVPLLYHQFKLDSISAKKIFVNLEVDEKGDLLLAKYLASNKSPQKDLKNFNLKYSDKMPDINVEKYRVSLIQGEKNYSIKGSKFLINDFTLNKKINLYADGIFLNQNKKQISYNLNLNSKVFPKKSNKKFDIMKMITDFDKYNVFADLKSNIKLKDNNGELDIQGKSELKNLTFNLAGKTFPKSSIKLNFKGSKAQINSNIYTDTDSKITANGTINTGKKKFIDIAVKSDKINLKDVLLIAKTTSNTFGKKNLENIDAKGYLNADFIIKSDFKTLKSNGYLKIKNASFTHKIHKISLNDIDADIDFSQNSLKIKKANAKLNNQPIIIAGEIDKNAFANIRILAEKLQLKGLLLTLGHPKILNENDITGLVNLTVDLKGRIDKAKPKISLFIIDTKIKNKKSNAEIKIAKTTFSSDEQGKLNNLINLENILISQKAIGKIYAPKLNLKYQDDKIELPKSSIFIDNIKTTIKGSITGINTTPTIENIEVATPSTVSVRINSIPNSIISINGLVKIKGSLTSPEISGHLSIPVAKLPQYKIYSKSANIIFSKDSIFFNCPQVQIAGADAKLSGEALSEIKDGIIIKYLNFYTDNLDLNTIFNGFATNGKSTGQNIKITVLNGKSQISNFKVGKIIASDATSNLSIKNNILHLTNLRTNAYGGKIAGNIDYDFNKSKVHLNLQGRELYANPALVALTYRDDDINGIMAFDSNVSFNTYSIVKTLQGTTEFIVKNGKMGMLGKFEHLLYAQNILSNSVFKATLNVIVKALSTKDTGVYRYMKGKINFSNGWINIQWIKTSGPTMSLYMTGRYYMPESIAAITILGKISDDVVKVLGPIGEFSMDKAISSIPKLGEVSSFIAKQFTTSPNYENISQIPPLSVKSDFKTKDFKVVISGDIHKQSSVKSFKWLSNPTIVNSAQNHQQQAYPPKQINADIPDFVKNLPDLRN